jgi:hypothetical protein
MRVPGLRLWMPEQPLDHELAEVVRQLRDVPAAGDAPEFRRSPGAAAGGVARDRGLQPLESAV